MMKCNELIWCPTNMLLKLLLISFLLQHSLGFDNFEGENPADEPAFLHFLQDGYWPILKKVPRGYMFPVPRVGRREIREEKRQNMIPQPRIGRELDINDQLADVLHEIQKMFLGGYFLPSQFIFSDGIDLGNEYPVVSDDMPSNYAKRFAVEKQNDVHLNKDEISRDETDALSRITGEDGTKKEQKSRDGHIIRISYFPNKDGDILSREAKYSGFGISDDEKRTGLIPLSQIGRNRLLAALEDKNLAGGLIAYPRLGRHVWELQQALLPYPRAGRLIVDPSSLDYDIFLKADLSNDDSLTDAFLTSGPIIQKRGNMKLIPRIGRKKRSVSDAGEKKESESERNNQESDHGRSIWNNLDDLDTDYFFRGEKKMSKNAFAPRIGKKRSEYSDGYDENSDYFKAEEKKMSKNAFAPRIGKKWPEYPDVYDEKRAAAFTPRIGRAALIPRIGRSDPRFRLRSRAAFVPRIGRRAALIPRIGRSESQRTVKVDTD